MMKFNVIENVEMNDVCGGWIVVNVIENDVNENVMLSFDFGESLYDVSIVDKEVLIEDVFSKEVCEKLWDVEIF